MYPFSNLVPSLNRTEMKPDHEVAHAWTVVPAIQSGISFKLTDIPHTYIGIMGA